MRQDLTFDPPCLSHLVQSSTQSESMACHLHAALRSVHSSPASSFAAGVHFCRSATAFGRPLVRNSRFLHGDAAAKLGLVHQLPRLLAILRTCTRTTLRPQKKMRSKASFALGMDIIATIMSTSLPCKLLHAIIQTCSYTALPSQGPASHSDPQLPDLQHSLHRLPSHHRTAEPFLSFPAGTWLSNAISGSQRVKSPSSCPNANLSHCILNAPPSSRSFRVHVTNPECVE